MTSDIELFLKAHKGAPRDEEIVPEVDALVISEGKIYNCTVNSENIYVKQEIDFPIALGSGRRLAMMAMDCGKTAEEAVKMTTKRDINTGGTIRTYKI